VNVKDCSGTICNPTKDSGLTQGDGRTGFVPFCIWFARGCCTKGHSCFFKHHIPSPEECLICDSSIDVFGRKRYAQHSRDLEGVGSFLYDCRRLHISNVSAEDERVLLSFFSMWGEVEKIKNIPKRRVCFVEYVHRCSAEFAKIASQLQALSFSPSLRVTWAR